VLLFSPFVGSVISLTSVGVDEITASNKNNILSQMSCCLAKFYRPTEINI
jgi:hypothetical protein